MLWRSPLVVGLIGIGRVASSSVLHGRNLEDSKYFHEPGDTDVTSHYDIRYFTEVVDYSTRLDTLKHMIRAWLQITNEENIETWIAHGTLLGWWWNGEVLPWDWDLDVQVHGDTLQTLGENYNMTMHSYSSEDGNTSRLYLLDVNPNSAERIRGDGMNVIDARWIDVRNGLYIDITGISETSPVEEPGFFYCKNLHRYRYDDIWPLRDTTFEGSPAKIPYNYEDILIQEYKSKALISTEYEGHRWNPKTKTWDMAEDLMPGKSDAEPLSHPHIPEKYENVDAGGFWYNLFRLVHWW